MSRSWEIPVADLEMWDDLMRAPLRYRQLSIWDWMLPPDDSLEVYRQNLKALGKDRAGKMRTDAAARHLSRYGHEAGYDRHGKCRTCTGRRVAKRYRETHGIPLDAPLMSPREAAQRAVASRKRRAVA